jgi:hypothetical protein
MKPEVMDLEGLDLNQVPLLEGEENIKNFVLR